MVVVCGNLDWVDVVCKIGIDGWLWSVGYCGWPVNYCGVFDGWLWSDQSIDGDPTVSVKYFMGGMWSMGSCMSKCVCGLSAYTGSVMTWSYLGGLMVRQRLWCLWTLDRTSISSGTVVGLMGGCGSVKCVYGSAGV